MLAFRMKAPTQEVAIEKQLASRIDTEKWGAGPAKDLIQKVDGMRKRMAAASRAFAEKGADECREVFGRYHSLVYQASIVCEGISLKDASIAFRWADAFDDSTTQIADWTFERASVLFNLAASLSFIATHKDRGEPEGLKAACGLYQQAAGVLRAVREVVKKAAWTASADIAPDTLEALEALMLAQAQKTFVEKATGDGMSNAVLSKLCAECAALYTEVGMRIAEAKTRARPISAMTSEWLAVVEWNRLHFDGLQHYHQGIVDASENRYGAAVSRLTHATNQAASAVNACAGAAPALQEQFKRAHATSSEAWTKMKRDNDLIYCEKVPPILDLSKPERKCLVKPSVPPEVEKLDEPTPLPPKATPVAAAAAVVAAVSISDADDAPAPAPAPPPPPSFAEAEAAGLVELVAMGFSKAKAEAALAKAGGSVQAATELLLAES